MLLELLTVLASGAAATATGLGYVKHRRVKSYEEKVRDVEQKLAKERLATEALVALNDEVVYQGLTPAHVTAALKKNPELVTPELVVKAFSQDPEAMVAAFRVFMQRDEKALRRMMHAAITERFVQDGVVHDWKSVGTRRIKVPISRDKSQHYRLRTDMCQRCRVEHQFFEDVGHPSVQEMEGFFLGGKRLAEQPPCVSLSQTDDKAA